MRSVLITLVCLAWTVPVAKAAPGSPAASPPSKAGARSAPADAPPESDAPPAARTPDVMTPKVIPKSFSHRYQVSLDAAIGLGGSFLITYKDSTWCGTRDGGENETFCMGMTPAHVDLGVGFGIVHQLEIMAEFRLGLTRDTVGNRPFMFMPGLRIWIDAHKQFKVAMALLLVLDFTKQEGSQQSSYGLPEKGENLDVGGRLYVQLQYDFLRFVGLFGRLGVTTTVLRWVQINLEAQIGVQARFP